jgi:uncharacterized repeat protein (TIGR03803 family)
MKKLRGWKEICGVFVVWAAIGAQGQTFNKLVNFNGSDGRFPCCSLIQGTDGDFYGTTHGGGDGYGTVFKFALGGGLTTLHTFEFDDGADPESGIIQSTSGTFYGSTGYGGIANSLCRIGCGTLFSLSTGLGPFVSLVHSSGYVGQTGGILGQGFTGTTSVSLNGTPAKFTVRSDTCLIATVPAGATGGFVTVVTPGGTLTSNKPFMVLP